MSMHAERRKLAGIARAKRSALGRVICRLMGDETGAVMMEYVILSVLVAAAVVVAVIYFGRTIMTQFGAAAQATAGQTKKAEKASKDATKEAKNAEKKGDKSNKSFHDQK
jgi:Flp pilus assembly pilin Flp